MTVLTSCIRIRRGSKIQLAYLCTKQKDVLFNKTKKNKYQGPFNMKFILKFQVSIKMNKERLQFPKDISGIQGSILGAINENIYMCYLENNGIIITDYYNRYL